MEKLMCNVLYRLLLLTNLDNEDGKGGSLFIGIYTSNPDLVVGDTFSIHGWKIPNPSVPCETPNQASNEALPPFSAKVMKIEKTAVRKEAFYIDIYVESPDRVIVDRIRESLRANNPNKF